MQHSSSSCQRASFAAVLVAALLCLVSVASAAGIPSQAGQYRAGLIRAAHAFGGLDAPVADFAAQIEQESRWRPNARSHVGAQGMAQFMPATARWICGVYADELPGCDVTNPAWAMAALVRYDRVIWSGLSAATDCDRMAMALSGYNGGPGWVARDKRLAADHGADPDRWWGHVERFSRRSEAAFAENRGYPRRILLALAPRYVNAGWGRSMCRG